jgi:DENN domain-containing protein 4
MNNDNKIVDYFSIVGLDKNDLQLYPDISIDAQKINYKRDPLVDLIIINRQVGETLPDGYECIFTTQKGFSANLHGNSKTTELLLCYKRGRDQPPITDIG